MKNNVQAGLTAVEFKDATWVRYMWWVYIIGLIWSSEFVLACQHMIISGAVAKWYFTKCVFYVCAFIRFILNLYTLHMFLVEKIKNLLFFLQFIIWCFIIWVQ